MNVGHRLALACAVAAFAPPGILLAAAPHSGIVVEDGFEASDAALFAVAAAGVWLARRSIRARAKRRSPSGSSEGGTR